MSGDGFEIDVAHIIFNADREQIRDITRKYPGREGSFYENLSPHKHLIFVDERNIDQGVSNLCDDLNKDQRIGVTAEDNYRMQEISDLKHAFSDHIRSIYFGVSKDLQEKLLRESILVHELDHRDQQIKFLKGNPATGTMDVDLPTLHLASKNKVKRDKSLKKSKEYLDLQRDISQCATIAEIKAMLAEFSRAAKNGNYFSVQMRLAFFFDFFRMHDKAKRSPLELTISHLKSDGIVDYLHSTAMMILLSENPELLTSHVPADIKQLGDVLITRLREILDRPKDFVDRLTQPEFVDKIDTIYSEKITSLRSSYERFKVM